MFRQLRLNYWALVFCLSVVGTLLHSPLARAAPPKKSTKEQQKTAKASDDDKKASDELDRILKSAFDRSMMGVSQGTALMQMNLVSADGVKKERTLLFKTRRADDGQLQYLIKFEKPSEIKGTAFLVRERKGQLPDQYVYIPAAKVVRRVAAGNASSSFFGSDFLYADLLPYPTDGKNEVGTKKLPDSQLGGQAVYVIEIMPNMAEAPYKKLIAYIQRDQRVTLQIEFFDQANKLLKVMRVRKLKTVEGKLVPVDIEMKNVQTKTSTELIIENINTKANLTANDFTEEAMQR